MKKIFNLAVIFAALMTAVSFASCSDEDDASDKVEEQQLTSVSVEKGETYAFTNTSMAKSGYFKVVSVSGTKENKNRVVEIKITTKKDDAAGKTCTLGEDANHTSYLMWDGSAFSNVFQKDAVENAAKIIFCLSTDATGYTITSATVNKEVDSAGATETLFAKK